jgi:hypothetical protein
MRGLRSDGKHLFPVVMPEAIRTACKRLSISRDKHCRIAPLCGNAREDVCRPCWSATCASRRPTSGKSVDLQRDALLAAGVDERHLHEDCVSGARDDRPGLKTCLADLKPSQSQRV